MRRVVLESPYADDPPKNIAYAKACIRHCLQRHDAPLASHLLYTLPDLLDDTKPGQRALGIEAGHVWIEQADCLVVYIDRLISNGMMQGILRARKHRISIELWSLDNGLLSQLQGHVPNGHPATDAFFQILTTLSMPRYQQDYTETYTAQSPVPADEVKPTNSQLDQIFGPGPAAKPAPRKHPAQDTDTFHSDDTDDTFN